MSRIEQAEARAREALEQVPWLQARHRTWKIQAALAKDLIAALAVVKAAKVVLSSLDMPIFTAAGPYAQTVKLALGDALTPFEDRRGEG